MPSSLTNDRSGGDAAERSAAQAVCDLLSARDEDASVSARDFAPSDPEAAAAYWRAVESVACLCQGPGKLGFLDLTLSLAGRRRDDGDGRAVRLASDAIPGYEILSELSRGGQGVVYRAVQKSTKRHVAIKVPNFGGLASDGARRRFEREIELVAQLRHPSIIAIFHSGETDAGQQFYVMDYVEGAPLHQYVRERQLTLRQTLRLFRMICDAVQYAHQRGVIHRDLKPSNILVDTEGRPRILDFGLAKPIAGAAVGGDISMSQDVIGTLPYMSPEQARGELDEVDTRTDVYALGVILYKLLTGQYPYPISGPMPEVLRNIAETQPAPPAKRWTKGMGVQRRQPTWARRNECPIDSEVQTIVLKALSKERERRYQSAGELGRDLGRYLEGDPVEAKRDSTFYVLQKGLQRHKGSVAAAIGFAVVLVGFGVLMWGQAQRMAALAETNQTLAQTANDVKVWALQQRDVFKGTAARLQRTVYRDSLRLAEIDFERGDIAGVRRLLAECDESLRDWEWRRLMWLANHVGDTSAYDIPESAWHRGAVQAMAFASDGALLLTGGADGKFKIWDVDRLHAPLTLPVGDDAVTAIAVTSDNSQAAVGTASGDVQLWDLASARVVRTWDSGHGAVRGVAFSPHAKQLISVGDDGMLRLWSTADDTAPVVTMAHEGAAVAAVFTSDGKRIVTAGADGVVRLWDAATAKCVLTLPGHEGAVNAVVLHPLRNWAISGGQDGVVRVWNIDTRREIAVCETRAGAVRALALTPDGARIVSIGVDSRNAQLWETDTGAALLTLHGDDAPLLAICSSSDGRFIAAGDASGCVKLWCAESPGDGLNGLPPRGPASPGGFPAAE